MRRHFQSSKGSGLNGIISQLHSVHTKSERNTRYSVYATTYIGNGSSISATKGALTIASDVVTTAKLYFLGVNAAALGIRVSDHNSFYEHVLNTMQLGDNVSLMALKGDMTVRAKNDHTGDVTSNNTNQTADDYENE